jgi:hypothetical protein
MYVVVSDCKKKKQSKTPIVQSTSQWLGLITWISMRMLEKE